MRNAILVIILSLPTLIYAQSISRSTLGAAGSNQEGSAGSLNYTFGQGNSIEIYKVGNSILTQGFQQWRFDCELTGTSLSNDTLICQGDSVELVVTGGNQYDWSPVSGLSANNEDTVWAKPSATTTYFVTITDTLSGCFTSDSVRITVEPASTVSGTLRNSNGKPITDGFVKLLKFDTSRFNFLPVSDSVAVDASGNFSFSDVHSGDFLLFAKADKNVFPNTLPSYYDSVRYWRKATRVTVDCNSSYNVDFYIKSFPTPKEGKGKLSGVIAFETGFGSRNKRAIAGKTEGDPVPDVDVVLEQIPGGEIKGVTTTNSQGFYEFTKVELGHKYRLHVEIPGVDMDSITHEVELSADDTTEQDLDFVVDSVIRVEDSSATSIIAQTARHWENPLNVYPNPYKDFTNITFRLEKKAIVRLEVFNLLGRSVTLLENDKLLEGKYNYRFSAREYGFEQGVYLVKLIAGDNTYLSRIIETH